MTYSEERIILARDKLISVKLKAWNKFVKFHCDNLILIS